MTKFFSTDYQDVLKQLERVDPVAYGRTRNFSDGAVTRLSPYISRGVVSTRDVFKSVSERNFKPYEIEKFVQELAWRDYWQEIGIAKGTAIEEDLLQPQPDFIYDGIPDSVSEARTGIKAIDDSLVAFYETGYLHNHLRMYIASLVCNVGRYHWKMPARWMYYHLLDADWASNTLSWQWVAGSNSKKKYYANQENINRYCYTIQRNTYLDADYEQLGNLPVPPELKAHTTPIFSTALPVQSSMAVDTSLPVCLYNFYNLDPLWHKDIQANRILLLEPSHFGKYPVSAETVRFMLGLAENIQGIQVYTGEFRDLIKEFNIHNVLYKEHPLNAHYEGKKESRDSIFSVKGYFPSFFSFWKQCVKEWKS